MRRGTAVSVLLAALVTGGTASGAFAHDAHRHSAAPNDNAASTGGAPRERVPRRLDEAEQRRYFTDRPLLDQDGRSVRFYDDVLKGKIVVVSFVFTGCTDVCPILMHNLQDVQDALGDRFGKDVFFVSISVDPENDTPKELKKYAERYGAKPGWTLLTGEKKDVDAVIRKFGEFSEEFEEHSILFVLGDVKNARWSKLRGDLPPEMMLPKIRDLVERREAAPRAR